MKASFLRIVLSICLLVSCSQFLVAQVVEPIPLISTILNKNPNIGSINGLKADAIQSQIVSLNNLQSRDLIQLNLFGFTDLVAKKTTIDLHKNGIRVWRGKIVGQKWGYVLISYFKDQYWVKIELDDGRLFQIQSHNDKGKQKEYYLQELTRSNNQNLAHEHEIVEENKSPTPSRSRNLPHTSVCDVDSDCANKVVHIMVVYTQAAIDYFGSITNTENAIATHVSEINTINSNSGVNHTVNLVHTAGVDYTEVDGATDLSRLANSNDGYLDQIHVWRQQYGADIVSMIGDLSGCGQAIPLSDPTNFTANTGFNFVKPACMVQSKTLAHEVGHNLGLSHDRYAEGNSTFIPCDWAYGFVNPNGVGGTTDQQWRTIMAYSDFCSDNGNYNCPRIPYWSNPDITFNGDPTGSSIGQPDASNNTYMLNRSFCVVAEYLPEPPCHPDYRPLKALYEAADGVNWNVNWDVSANSTCDVCSWDGITCNNQGRVISLDLSDKALNGNLAVEIGYLSELEVLRIRNAPNLTGIIPTEIGFLSSLKELDLTNNNLTGGIPSEIGNLVNLESILLGGNTLGGHLTRRIGILSNLKTLDVSNNNFIARIPSSFQHLTNLETLLINNNNFDGPLPKELANLSNTIVELNGSSNDFSDCFPVEFSSLCGKNISFNNNSNLQHQGDFNLFCASPNQACNQQSCSHPDYVALKALFDATGGEYWRDNDGWFADCDPCQGIPWSGVSCESNRVNSLVLSLNNLSGPIPPEIGQLEILSTLTAVNNNLTGPIPPEIGQLINLESLTLSLNNLSGSLPVEVGNLTNLKALQFARNNLTGSIPNEISNLTQLNFLSFSYNDLQGPLPPDLPDIPLTTFSLVNNFNFSGCYPDGYEIFCEPFINFNVDGTMLPSFQVYCDHGVGSCNSNCTNLDYNALEALYTGTNGANWSNNSGWLMDCDPCGEQSGSPWYGVTCDGTGRVTKLNLSNNQLSGTIPIKVSKINTLTELDLSNNQLTGALPSELSELTLLTILNLSNNKNSSDTDCSTTGLTSCIPTSFNIFCDLGTVVSLGGNCLEEDDFGAYCSNDAGSCEDICTHPDYAALEAFFNSTNGEFWTENTDWLSNCDPCGIETGNTAWYGLYCIGDRIRAITFVNNNLTGTLPEELGQLENIESIYIPANDIGGTLPISIGELDLTSLFLSGNNFVGCIPSEYYHFCDIETTVVLSGNTGLTETNFTNFCSSCSGFCTAQDCPLIESCPDTLILAHATFQDSTLKAGKAILSTDTINSPNIITYAAGQSITLNAGFQVQAGSDFHALIEPCADSDLSSVVNAREAQEGRTPIVVDPTKQSIALSIFPNPFSNNTTIQFYLPEAAPIYLQLRDVTGKALQSVLSNTPYEAGIHQVTLQNEGLNAGIYFLQLHSEREQVIQKVMIIR